MGQKVNPHGIRVGVIKDWDSRWFASKQDFSDNLVEDHKIRTEPEGSAEGLLASPRSRSSALWILPLPLPALRSTSTALSPAWSSARAAKSAKPCRTS